MPPGQRRRFYKPSGSTKRRSRQPRMRRILRALVLSENRLTLYMGGLLLVVVLLILARYTISHRSPPVTSAISKISLTSPEYSAEPTEVAALVALERFFEAPDVASMAAAAHDSTRVRPLMEDYYLHRRHPLPSMSRVSKGQAANSNGTQLILFQVEPLNGRHYPIATIWEGNRFAVDWESLSAYGTVDWVRFIEEKPASPETLRLYIEAAGEFDEVPGLPPTYTVFRISHRDDPLPITAIADAEWSRHLLPMVEKRRVPVTLEMEWQPLGPGHAPVPVILRLVSAGWSR